MPRIYEVIARSYHFALGGEKDLTNAVKWYRKAAELGVGSAQDYMGLFYSGGHAGLKQSCAEALYWYDRAIKNGYEYSYGNKAWMLATCPDKSLRNGREALQIMNSILKENYKKTAGNLDTLAAAYAEIGDFKNAVEVQETALHKLQGQKNTPRYRKFEERLSLYKNSKTWYGWSYAYPEEFDQ
ncbi:SEL1-like repeat protein [Kangiella sp. TOML190]|uniref:SEL1-like repeat protein n=1 Tax=Kangiella sp. TOML190 TaxID=2931351 RepID=UPI00203D9019|nr:hypothetical protein [Kangiella sp. TOML190]